MQTAADANVSHTSDTPATHERHTSDTLSVLITMDVM